jgi:carbonic anhydrase/acetyltransferase-like protein (isoleucine patch superfamily)
MFLEEYKGKYPTISPKAKVFRNACISGDVTLKDGVNVWYNVSIRGDMAKVEIGENTNVQDNSVIHTNTDMPTIIGKNNTIGHNAIIHACTIGDGCLIGMGSIILDGAVIEDGALVGAGTVVPPHKTVPKNTLVVGNPMRIIRELSKEELQASLDNTNYYLKLMKEYN